MRPWAKPSYEEHERGVRQVHRQRFVLLHQRKDVMGGLERREGEKSGLRRGTETIEQQIAGLGHQGPGHDEAFAPERIEGLDGVFVVCVPAVGKREPDEDCQQQRGGVKLNLRIRSPLKWLAQLPRPPPAAVAKPHGWGGVNTCIPTVYPQDGQAV
jgi:hypothetical protein